MMLLLSKRSLSAGVVVVHILLLLCVSSVPVESDDGHHVRRRSMDTASKEDSSNRQENVEDEAFWNRFLEEEASSFPPSPSPSPTKSPSDATPPAPSPSDSPVAVVADFTGATAENPLTYTSFGSDFVQVLIENQEDTVYSVQGDGNNIGSTCPPPGGVKIPSSATVITIPLGGVDTTIVICRGGFIIGVSFFISQPQNFDYQQYVDFSGASSTNPLSFNFQSGPGTGLVGNGGYFLGGGTGGSSFFGRGGFFFTSSGAVAIGDQCPPAGAILLPFYPEFPFTLFTLEAQESDVVVYACDGIVIGTCEFEYIPDGPPPTGSPVAVTDPPTGSPSPTFSSTTAPPPPTVSPTVAAVIINGQLFNTGVDATGTALGPGMEDPHYLVVENDNTPAMAMFAPGSYFPNNENSTWIWQTANGQPTFVTRTFETTFDLTGYDSTSAKITGMWGADNFGLDILINSVSTGITASNFLQLFPIAIDLGFVAGQNVLQFVVQDVGGISGFRVDSIELTAIPDATS